MDTTAIKESQVTFQGNQGMETKGTMLRMGRYATTFDIYGTDTVLRTSEVLGDFKITWQGRTLYSGRAIVRSFVNTGTAAVCEVTLEDSWLDVDFSADSGAGQLGAQFQAFIGEWQKLYRVQPEFKVIVADMQTFLTDMRLWLNQVELGIRASPSADRVQLEVNVADELVQPVIPCVNALFEKFEGIACKLDLDLRPAHSHYMRRQLHPLVLCAPFAYRTFHKPLGYAGDYEMVNMIVRNEHEGGSLFAKVVNTWFLRQPPAEAHRNRIDYLVHKLQDETVRTRPLRRPARIFNVACGPAQEVQRFLAEHRVCDETEITLLDFNEETLQYLRTLLGEARSRYQRRTALHYIKKSVHTILKESGRSVERSPENQYDMVYCAGLFDYLTDSVCQRLMDIMYEWVVPGGLLLATNVEPTNPLRNGMEHLLDWHLVYRTGAQMEKIRPRKATAEDARVYSDATGVNVFLEVRKPDNG